MVKKMVKKKYLTEKYRVIKAKWSWKNNQNKKNRSKKIHRKNKKTQYILFGLKK